ncbi:MAG: hypothetical protein MUP36_02380 [Demequinaceae bacterium]|nr:hypothetical protein [Demequinaceae bacterium]
MVTIKHTTRRVLGWELAAISFFHAAVLLWGAATWTSRLNDALEADYGDLASFVQENISSRGAPVEFCLAVLAALAGVGWVLVAERGYLSPFLEDWRGKPALVGGSAMGLLYVTAAVVPLLNIITPREVERIPSWGALGGWGDATFLLMFLIDVVVVAWWTVERARKPETKPRKVFTPR